MTKCEKIILLSVHPVHIEEAYLGMMILMCMSILGGSIDLKAH